MKYVLIGNSTAATFAVEGIRFSDGAAEIEIVSEETRPAYGRPLISYYLEGRTDAAHLAYRPASFYEGIKVRLGVRAVKIDPISKKVTLSDGTEIGYDRLLVATGSRPFVPPVEGLERVKDRFTFMTMDDALAIERALGAGGKRVFVLGAGLIGLKCAEGVFSRAAKITVADLAPRILPAVLDEEASALVQRDLEARGIEFRLGDTAARFEPDRAVLRSGEEIPFDLLVVAVGVRPNAELVRDAGGTVARGVVVDGRQETSLPCVYAAGDVCESLDACTGERRILAILPNAAEQGYRAGRCMAGGDAPSGRAFAVNALGLFGTHIATAGVTEGESDVVRGEGFYHRFFRRDGRLVGYVLVGGIERAGIYTSLIRDAVPLDTVDYELLKRTPALAAFGRKAREEKLARRQK